MIVALHELLHREQGDLFGLSSIEVTDLVSKTQRIRASLYATPPYPVYVDEDLYKRAMTYAVSDANDRIDAAHQAYISTTDPDAVETVRDPRTDVTEAGPESRTTVSTNPNTKSTVVRRPTFEVAGGATLNEVDTTTTDTEGGQASSTDRSEAHTVTVRTGQERELRRKVDSPREAQLRLRRYDDDVYYLLRSALDMALNVSRRA